MLAGVAFVLFAAASLPAAGGTASQPDLTEVLANYRRAIADEGAAPVIRMEVSGAVTGAGLSGTFHSWLDGDRERTDENLGPRSDRTLRIDDRYWYTNADGNSRELVGVLLRRARTDRFIESGAFASHPERCVVRGGSMLGKNEVFEIDVTAEGGETQTLYLDAVTWLPDRVAYDDDDGRTTVDFSDWRTVGGHRFAFRNVASDGDRAFDVTETTASVTLDAAVERTVFEPLVPRVIEMGAPQTIGLRFHDGHYYAPVQIAGRSFTFLVDTGAQNVILDNRVARELGLSPQGALEASGAARMGGLQVAKLPQLDVGSGRLRDIVVTTLDLGASTNGVFRIDGILGYPFFASAAVRLNLTEGTMTFGPPGSLKSAGERIAIQTDRGFPEANLRVNRTTDAPFIIDTGNAAELLLYRPFIDQHPGIVPFSSTNRNSYGIGGATSSYRSSLDELDFGSVPMYHAETDVMQATRGAFADRFDAGNVGLGLLRNFVITLDEANGAMYLERSTAFDDGRSRN
jgi:hypothetical protein